MKRVVVQIDRLVLKGYPRGEQHAFAADLEAELGRLLADPAAERLFALGQVSSLLVRLEGAGKDDRSERPGVSAARAIVGGLCR